MGSTTASKILAKTDETEKEFLNDLFEAKLKYVTTRLHWNEPQANPRLYCAAVRMGIRGHLYLRESLVGGEMAGERHRMALRFAFLFLWIGGFLGVVALEILLLPGVDYFGRLAVLSVYVAATVALLGWSARRGDKLSDKGTR